MPRTAPAEPLPDRLPPMLLRPGLTPAGAQDQWALELKWDGMRAQFRLARDGSWCLRSRPGRNCSDQFPELAPLADALHGRELLLDGELVCLGTDGRPAFHRLRRRLTASSCHAASLLAARDPATLIVFDVLHLDGRAVRALPYRCRRELLERTLPATGRCWRIPAPLNGALDAVLEVTRAHELEGVVAKRLDAPYQPGRRSGAWLKHKHRRQETFAVTGWRPAPLSLVDPTPSWSPAPHPTAASAPRAPPNWASAACNATNWEPRSDNATFETRRGTHGVAAGIWVDVDFHGGQTEPLRDAVMRAVHIDA